MSPVPAAVVGILACSAPLAGWAAPDQNELLAQLAAADRFAEEFRAFLPFTMKEMEARLVEEGSPPAEAKDLAGAFALRKARHLEAVYRAAVSPSPWFVREYALLLLKEPAIRGDNVSRTFLQEAARGGDPKTAQKAKAILDGVSNAAPPPLPSGVLAGLRLQALTYFSVTLNALLLPTATVNCDDLPCARAQLPPAPVSAR